MFNSKRLFLAVLALLFCGFRADATLSLVSKSTSQNCSACTSATLTLGASTGTGHLLVVMAHGTNGATGNISTVSGAGTWIVDTGCHATNGTVFGLTACAYNTSTTSGVGSLSLTFSASNNYRYEAIEYSFTGSSISFDTSNTSIHTGASTSQACPNLTLTGTNDVVLCGVIVTGTNTITSISGSYTIEVSGTASSQGGAAADLLNTASGTGPTWTTGSTTSITMMIAFKEASGGGTPGCKNGVTLLGAGC